MAHLQQVHQLKNGHQQQQQPQHNSNKKKSKKIQIFSEIVFEPNQEIKTLELLINTKKISIQNMDPCEPLISYLDVDKVVDQVMSKDTDSVQLSDHVSIINFEQKLDESQQENPNNNNGGVGSKQHLDQQSHFEGPYTSSPQKEREPSQGQNFRLRNSNSKRPQVKQNISRKF